MKNRESRSTKIGCRARARSDKWVSKARRSCSIFSVDVNYVGLSLDARSLFWRLKR